MKDLAEDGDTKLNDVIERLERIEEELQRLVHNSV